MRGNDLNRGRKKKQESAYFFREKLYIFLKLYLIPGNELIFIVNIDQRQLWVIKQLILRLKRKKTSNVAGKKKK